MSSKSSSPIISSRALRSPWSCDHANRQPCAILYETRIQGVEYAIRLGGRLLKLSRFQYRNLSVFIDPKTPTTCPRMWDNICLAEAWHA